MRAVTLGAGVAALLLVGLIRLYGSMTRALVQQALTEARAVLASGARAIASRRSSRAWKTPADRFVREKRFKGLRDATRRTPERAICGAAKSANGRLL